MFRKEFGKANMTSLVERVSRLAVVLKNPGRQSKLVMEGLIESLSPLPAHARRSITFDRGTEFTAWRHLKAGLGVDPWFCDPQSPLSADCVAIACRAVRGRKELLKTPIIASAATCRARPIPRRSQIDI